MCGIAGLALNTRSRGGKFPVAAFSEALLLEIEDRGKDATGYLSIGQNGRTKKPKIGFQRLDVTASDFVKTHKIDPLAHTVLLHTRAYTKGKPDIMDNNHPVVFNTCFVIHNGNINNDDEVIKECDAVEKRVGQVDSWAIAAALEHHNWNESADIIAALKMLRGGFAVAAVDPVTKPGKLLLAKGDNSPLFILTTPQGVFWASTEAALMNAWGKTIGTPPKQKANKAAELGIQSLNPGDWWKIDTDLDRQTITSGKFEVNRAYNHSAHVFQGYETYTRDKRDWTCWPNEKNCIFGDDCGSCHDEKCRCYEGNNHHPRMNKDVSFKEAVKRFAAFQRHVTKYNLTEDMISPNPTKGASTQWNEAEARRMKETCGSGTTGSGHPRMPFTSRNSFDGRVPSGGAFSKCYLCNQTFAEVNMIPTQVPSETGGKTLRFYCKACNAIDRDREADGEVPGHDPKLESTIISLTKSAVAASEMVETALVQTAMEFKVSPTFVRYCVFYQPSAKNLDVSADFAKLHTDIKQGFRENVKLVNELRELEGAKK